MQQDLNILSATLEDADAIAPMFDAYRRFYKAESDPEAASRFIRERLTKGDSRIFVAYVRGPGGKVPAGFTQLYPSFSSVSMKRVWILNDLFVEPDFRKSGIASALMNQAEAFAREGGAKGLSLATQATNESAQALYVKMGYKMDTQFYHFHLFF